MHTGGFAGPSTQASQSCGYGAINQMMMGMNMSLAGSSSPYYYGGYHQLMDPYNAGMIGGSPLAPGYTGMVVRSPPITGPFTQFLQAGIVAPIRGPSPPFSGTQLSSQSGRHTSDDTGRSKKSRGRDELEVSSPVKKSKST